jgi:hypothetical protein
MHSAEQILDILDRCAEAFSFPMLDNGYFYLAASRLSLYRDEKDWALVFELFGFSPRLGRPDVHVQTFASRLVNRDPVEHYVTPEAHAAYLERQPHDEYRSFFPIEGEDWIDPENGEWLATSTKHVSLRGRMLILPDLAEYERHGIALEDSPRVNIFELCRYLAAVERDAVLASDSERRTSVPPELELVLALDEWNHLDFAEAEHPSDTETFRQIAEVLATGEVDRYHPSKPPNNHWRNWPEGGRL